MKKIDSNKCIAVSGQFIVAFQNLPQIVRTLATLNHVCEKSTEPQVMQLQTNPFSNYCPILMDDLTAKSAYLTASLNKKREIDLCFLALGTFYFNPFIVSFVTFSVATVGMSSFISKMNAALICLNVPQLQWRGRLEKGHLIAGCI